VVADGTAFCVMPTEGNLGRCRLVAVDVAIGKQLWSVDLGPIPMIGDPPMTPIPAGACAVGPHGVISIRHSEDAASATLDEDTPRPSLVCLDARSGSLKWRASLQRWWPDREAAQGTLAATGDRAVFPAWSEGSGHRLLVYDLVAGRLLYELPCGERSLGVSGRFLASWLSYEDALTITELESGEEVATVGLPPAGRFCCSEVRAIGARFAVVQRDIDSPRETTRIALVGQ